MKEEKYYFKDIKDSNHLPVPYIPKDKEELGQVREYTRLLFNEYSNLLPSEIRGAIYEKFAPEKFKKNLVLYIEEEYNNKQKPVILYEK